MQKSQFQFFLAVLLLISSTTAYADPELEATDGLEATYSANTLDTLHFQTEARQFMLSPLYGTALSDQTATSSGTSTTTWVNSSLALNYGVSDLLSFYVYQAQQTSLLAGPNGGLTSTGGLQDPIFKLNYRLLGGLTGEHFLNISLGTSPSQGCAIKSSTTQSGNELRGGNAYYLAVNGTLVRAKTELQFNIYSTLYAAAQTQTNSVALFSQINSYNTLGINLTYRQHLRFRQFVQLGLDTLTAYVVNEAYLNQSTAWQVSHDLSASPSLTYGGLISRDLLVYLTYKFIPTSSFSTLTNYSSSQQDNAIYFGLSTTY